MSLILDTGAFLALESNDHLMWNRLKNYRQTDSPPKTHGGVIAQAWRGGTGRQALLARALALVEIVPLDEKLGHHAGLLLARSGLTDAIDAAVAALAYHGDQIFTSDPDDLGLLVAASSLRVDIVPV